MNIRSIFFFFLFSTIIFSCETQDDILLSKNINYTNDSTAYSNALEGRDNSDSFFLNSSQRDGSTLLIEVSYSGGCELHEFNVVWDGVIYESDCPQAYIVLTHNANNDSCEAFLTETLSIDLIKVFEDLYSDELKLIILNGSQKNI